MLDKGIPIYPEFLFGSKHSVFTYLTRVRKLHIEDGIWYEVLVKTTGGSHQATLERFLRETYNVILFYKITPDRKDHLGFPIHRVSDDQCSEYERLLKK